MERIGSGGAFKGTWLSWLDLSGLTALRAIEAKTLMG